MQAFVLISTKYSVCLINPLNLHKGQLSNSSTLERRFDRNNMMNEMNSDMMNDNMISILHNEMTLLIMINNCDIEDYRH